VLGKLPFGVEVVAGVWAGAVPCPGVAAEEPGVVDGGVVAGLDGALTLPLLGVGGVGGVVVLPPLLVLSVPGLSLLVFTGFVGFWIVTVVGVVAGLNFRYAQRPPKNNATTTSAAAAKANRASNQAIHLLSRLSA